MLDKSLKIIASIVFLIFPTTGYAQTMQNPLLNGVRAIEVACIFSGETFDAVTRDKLCDLLVDGASEKIGFPASINDEARPAPSTSKGTVRLGYFWIEADFRAIDDRSISGQLTWGNARPMRGAVKSQSGSIISLSLDADGIENEREFIASLLDSIVI